VPAFDLPLDELRRYTGRNPRPDDLDAYWTEALAELDALMSGDGAASSDVRLDRVEHPASYAECFDLWFTGVRGARVYAKYLRPVGTTAATSATGATRQVPAVVVFHGYSGHSPDWFELLPYVAQGFAVAALDCRGQGGRSQDSGGALGTTLNGHIVRGLEDDPRNLAFRHIFLDTVQLTRIVMASPEVDGTRVGVTGASQGGALTLACAALEPRVRAAAPVYPFLSDYLRVWEMDLAEEAYSELRQYLRRFDPTHARVEEMFTRLGYIDVQHLAERIEASVLMQTGLMDTICPPSTQFAAYNKIRSPKEIVLYPDFEHEDLPGEQDRILAFMVEQLAP
jgi:cephalosporin-C deacetylase